MKRTLRKKIVVATIAVLLVLGVTEVGLRYLLGLGDPPLMVAHPDIGYMFKSDQSVVRFGNRVAYNRFHQRSAPATPLPAPKTLRVLMVGDSVLNGGALTDQEETISEQYRKLLQSRCSCPVEVLAASAGSWGTGLSATS